MTVVYPNGIIDIIPWENGNVDKKNIQRFLTALLKDGESETISLKPGESIVGHYSARKKHFLLILMTKKNIRKHYHRSGNRISDHNFSAWKTVRRIPMKTRFHISGRKK